MEEKNEQVESNPRKISQCQWSLSGQQGAKEETILSRGISSMAFDTRKSYSLYKLDGSGSSGGLWNYKKPT